MVQVVGELPSPCMEAEVRLSHDLQTSQVESTQTKEQVVLLLERGAGEFVGLGYAELLKSSLKFLFLGFHSFPSFFFIQNRHDDEFI